MSPGPRALRPRPWACTRRRPARAGRGRAASAPSRPRRAGCLRRARGSRRAPRAGAQARALEQFLHRLLRERLEIQRCEVPLPGAPARPALHQLRPRERDHEDRVVPRPLEQDSTKSSRLASAHCMSSNDEHRRIVFGEPLEEEPPGGEQVLPLARGLLLGDPEQAREHPAPQRPARPGRACAR